MNNPSPLVPQGTLPHAARFKTNLRIAAVAIVAIHVVLFAGLLTQQGCKPDSKTASSEPTNALPAFDPAVFSPPPPAPEPVPATPPGVASTVAPGIPSAPPAGAPPATQPPYQPMAPGAPQPVYVPPPAPEPPPAPAVPAGLSEYTIKKGDYFEKIAKAHGLRTKDIVGANPGVDSTRLKVGQKLLLPASSAPSAPALAGDAAAGATVHVVKSGDTLTKIAKQHGVSLKALRSANNLKTDQIKVGQKIKVPSAAPASTVPPPAPEPVYVPVPAPPQPAPPPPAPPGVQ